MTSGGAQGQWEEREVYLQGSLDIERQKWAEAVLGRVSYQLLASKACRYVGQRTYLVEILIRELTECLKHPGSGSAFLNAQVLLWAAWSQVFMHLEDMAALLDATGEFGKQWDMCGGVGPDLIYERYLGFGDPETGSGASPASVFKKVSSSSCDARRALWLPSKKEWRQMQAPDTDYACIKPAVDNLRRITRAILEQIESDSGRKWCASYLRLKHGMPMVALDLFFGTFTMQYPPGQVPDEATTRAHAHREARRMRILMDRPPLSREGKGPHLQSFDCNAKAATQAMGSSRLLSEVEEYVCKSVVHRAESEGTRSFHIIRKAEDTPDG